MIHAPGGGWDRVSFIKDKIKRFRKKGKIVAVVLSQTTLGRMTVRLITERLKWRCYWIILNGKASICEVQYSAWRGHHRMLYKICHFWKKMSFINFKYYHLAYTKSMACCVILKASCEKNSHYIPTFTYKNAKNVITINNNRTFNECFA
jgi:hypothetical protein